MNAHRGQTEAIRARLSVLRDEFPEDWADARQEVRRKVSIQHDASRHPWIVIGGLALVGYLLVPKKRPAPVVTKGTSARDFASRWIPGFRSAPTVSEKHVDEVVAKSSFAPMIVSTLTTFALRAATSYATNHFFNRERR